MAAPMHELVGVAAARLRAYTNLTALVPASQILDDKAPAAYTPPYITVDDAFSIRDSMTCVDSILITLNVNVWTISGTPLQDARAIGWQVVKALHHYDLVLPNNKLITLANTGERVFYDADGTTGHNVVSFEATIEAA